ncbi:MAG: hypothetical protein Q9160_008311 [Pyrenula sp. 1 TL-2023]
MFSLSPDIKPTCQKAGWGAPQKDLRTWINDWCSSVDGQKVKRQPGDPIFKMIKVSYYSSWLSAQWSDTPPDKNKKCEDEVAISKNDCVKDLTAAMEKCDLDGGDSHGGSLATSCISYNITMDGSQNDKSPPWHPLSATDQAGECDRGQASDIAYSLFDGIYPTFCAEVDKDPKAKQSKTYTQKDLKQPPQPRLSRIMARTPPPSTEGKYGGDYQLGFNFTGATGDCRKTCSDAMSTLSKSCGHSGNQQNSMTKSASIEVGCGKYEFGVTNPNPDEVQCTLSHYAWAFDDARTFSLSDANKAIDQFCTDDAAHVASPSEQQQGFYPDYNTYKGAWPHRHWRFGDTELELSAQFAQNLGSGLDKIQCKNPAKAFKVKDYADRCKELLGRALNECKSLFPFRTFLSSTIIRCHQIPG